MSYRYTDEVSLLVSSSDDYETTWYPYFELVKRYWRNHPRDIYLNSETKTYADSQLRIHSLCAGREGTWSQRLLHCLEQIPTEYVIFSLEDAFLLGDVDDEAIERCLTWMQEDSRIAVCRLKTSSLPQLQPTAQYGDFRLAGDDTPYRLDTQVALWRKKDLMSFIDETESPWQFEKCGTQRIKGTEKLFLWYWSAEEEDESRMIFPYHIDQRCGYGVAWGRWLWKNRSWFERNGISAVRYSVRGTLSERSVRRRFRYLYRTGLGAPKGLEKVIYHCYRLVDRVQRGWTMIRLRGLRRGIRSIIRGF